MSGTRFYSSLVGAALLLSPLSLSAQEDGSWSYDGATGPANWGALSNDYALCSTGQLQSPINIEGTEPVILNDLKFRYGVTPINLKHDGYQIAQRYNSGSDLTVGDHSFSLDAVAFRTPSEHKVAGNGFPMAIQFHHSGENGEKAVISVMVREGAENLAITEYLPHLPLEAGQSTRNAALVNARDLIPFDGGYYRYNGSSTTPPCIEDVRWYIMKQPIEMSSAQINVFRGLIGNKARPVQARGNRIILDSAQ